MCICVIANHGTEMVFVVSRYFLLFKWKINTNITKYIHEKIEIYLLSHFLTQILESPELKILFL